MQRAAADWTRPRSSSDGGCSGDVYPTLTDSGLQQQWPTEQLTHSQHIGSSTTAGCRTESSELGALQRSSARVTWQRGGMSSGWRRLTGGKGGKAGGSGGPVSSCMSVSSYMSRPSCFLLPTVLTVSCEQPLHPCSRLCTRVLAGAGA